MEAYLKLTALQNNVPKAREVKERYVREYNSILDLLAQASGYDLNGFRVPESEIHQKELWFTLDSDTNESEVRYTPDLYCARTVLMKKLGTILPFFNTTFPTPGKPRIDFTLPNK
jgi:hypothetical protein